MGINQSIICTTILAIILFNSCNVNEAERNPKTLFGMDFNTQREKVGLMLIAGNEQCSIFSNRITWKSIDFDTLKLELGFYYAGKIISFEHDTIVNETDIFMFPNVSIDMFGEKSNELLMYSYTFFPTVHHGIGWTYYFFTNHENKLRGEITKQQADSILHLWGLKYP